MEGFGENARDCEVCFSWIVCMDEECGRAEALIMRIENGVVGVEAVGEVATRGLWLDSVCG